MATVTISCKTMVTGVTVVVLLLVSLVSGVQGKHKRQIFREQVLPHSGGKIPEDAFRADRLALNRLNKDGIAVPDGIVLDARRRDKHPNVRHNSDLEMSVIKVVLTPDGRYVPPEGRYHYDNPITVDSTYIIRPPIGSYKHEHRRVPQQTYHHPAPVALDIPNKEVHPQVEPLPFYLGLSNGHSGSYVYHTHHSFFSDHYYPFYTPQTLSDFDALFEEFGNGRLVRQSAVIPQHPPPPEYRQRGAKVPGLEGRDYPGYTRVPQTQFSCAAHPAADKMYPDPQTKCQVFHYCQKDGRHDSFICPKGTLFNGDLGHCDWWYNVKCR